MKRVLLWLGISVLFFGVGFLFESTGRATGRDTVYLPQGAIAPGSEIMMVLLCSPSCPACNDPALAALIEDLKIGLARKADSLSIGFSAVGVGLSRRPEPAFEQLSRFGSFDELILGRGWVNSGAIDYLWQDLPGVPETPQVVVVERVIEVTDAPTYGIHQERLLGRYVSHGEIERWLRSGLPLRR